MIVELTGKGDRYLQEIADKKGCSKKDILTYALTLFHIAMEEDTVTTINCKNGNKIILKANSTLTSLKSLE